MIVRLLPSQVPLAALCAALSGVLVWEMSAPIDVPRALPSRAVRTQIATAFPDAGAPPATETFDDVEGRLVFNPSRQPTGTMTGATLTGDATASGFALVGVILDGAKRIALVRRSGDSATTRAGEGDTVGGWTIAKIEPDRITLRSGAAQKEIALTNH